MRIRILFFALLLSLGAGILSGQVNAAEANGKNIYLQPGDIYDAGSARNNTTVYMDKIGEYTLKGKSDNVRFIIKTGGVKVYLADGLYIDPGAYANTGKKASAISVQHKSGDVTLISKAGASIYFSNHDMAPAIHQDGTDGKLIFETENPDDPGKIIAKCAKKSNSAAIGECNGTTGNIVFNSGYIYATGGDYAAGIGGGNGGKGKNITINGGYINAKGGEAAAGIGSGMYEGAAEITINGGEVVAKGGKGGAGIGCGMELEIAPIKGEHITITGGTVTAIGGMGSAGIGGGRNADGEHIEITGGEVDATGGSAGGAGIGGGGSYDAFGYGGDSYIGGDGRHITISGGTVTATGGENGAGIGGGCEEGNGESITISGGTVVADGGDNGAGIGGAVKGRAKNITITGGKVTATGAGGGAGIGGGMHAWGHDLKISGGIVRATGGKKGDGIGGGNKPGIFYKDFTNSIFISGGTVIAARGSEGSADIGGRGKSTVSITGGSVLPRNHDVNQAPKNQAGDTVYMTTVSFYYSFGEDYAEHKIDSLNFTDKTPAYGTNDLYNVNSSYSAVWPWLPKKSGVGVVSGTLTEDDGVSKTTKKYTAMEVSDQTTDPWIIKPAAISPGSRGTMYPPNDIILDGSREQIRDGSATGEYMETKLGNFKPAEGSITGMHIEGYGPSRVSDECITDADGNLRYNAFFSGTEYVNEKNQWCTVGSQITLYAFWSINYYNVRFDKNKPKTASHEVSGYMEDQRIQYGINDPLKPNNYKLAGWKFVGWHTEPDRKTNPDGTKTPPAYMDESVVMNMTAEHDATVTLYAQWEPMEYTVTFDDGDAGEKTHTQTIKYDTPTKLDAVGKMNFTAPAGKEFLGWNVHTIGHLYEDEATVYNFCTPDESTGALTGRTLTAQWRDANHDVVLVTLDGEVKNIEDTGLPGKWDKILLQKEGESALLEMQCDKQQAPGVYWIEDLPTNGVYHILLRNSSTSKTLSTGKTFDISVSRLNVEALDYCTVEIEMEQGKADYGNVWLDDKGGDESVKKTVLLSDEQLKINCEITKTGHRFAEYTASYHPPAWQDGDAAMPDQTITVNGKTIITAHVEPIRYSAKFNANVTDAAGSMPNQDFVYGHPQNLFACQYQRKGYTFAGWTTTPEWMSMKDLYKDGARIEDGLTAVHGETVTLYAHWWPLAYDIYYDSNGAASGIQLTRHHTYHDNTTHLRSTEDLNFGMENYHFTGWNTKSGGNGTAYEAGQEVSNLADGNESITLYAQWAHDSYTIHYDGNGGKGSMFDEVFWINAHEPLHASVFQKDGYTFTGWNTKRDGTGAAYKDREEVMNLAETGGTVTLYAQWNKTPSGKAKQSGGTSPTGDDLPLWPLILLMTGSLCGIIALKLKKGWIK